eukprot:2705677-Pleurochrysis_carterae.AAC.6
MSHGSSLRLFESRNTRRGYKDNTDTYYKGPKVTLAVGKQHQMRIHVLAARTTGWRWQRGNCFKYIGLRWSMDLVDVLYALYALYLSLPAPRRRHLNRLDHTLET